MDVDVNNYELTEEYMREAIRGFQNEYSTGIVEILSKRDMFKDLILYLKDCCGFKYNEYGNCYYIGNKTNKYLVLVKAKNTSITSCTINSNTKFIYGFFIFLMANSFVSESKAHGKADKNIIPSTLSFV